MSNICQARFLQIDKMSQQCELVEESYIEDIHFLSANTLIATSSRRFIEIFKFDDPAISDGGMVSIIRFDLPNLAGARQYGFIHARLYPMEAHSRVKNPSSSIERPAYFPSPD